LPYKSCHMKSQTFCMASGNSTRALVIRLGVGSVSDSSACMSGTLGLTHASCIGAEIKREFSCISRSLHSTFCRDPAILVPSDEFAVASIPCLTCLLSEENLSFSSPTRAVGRLYFIWLNTRSTVGRQRKDLSSGLAGQRDRTICRNQ
jgi:hypothetical protein